MQRLCASHTRRISQPSEADMTHAHKCARLHRNLSTKKLPPTKLRMPQTGVAATLFAAPAQSLSRLSLRRAPACFCDDGLPRRRRPLPAA
jgi:hypothetical protein